MTAEPKPGVVGASRAEIVAAQEALLLMAGFTKIPGIGEDDPRRRLEDWQVRMDAKVSVDEIMRHTRIPLPLKAALRSGRVEIRRRELTRSEPV